MAAGVHRPGQAVGVHADRDRQPGRWAHRLRRAASIAAVARGKIAALDERRRALDETRLAAHPAHRRLSRTPSSEDCMRRLRLTSLSNSDRSWSSRARLLAPTSRRRSCPSLKAEDGRDTHDLVPPSQLRVLVGVDLEHLEAVRSSRRRWSREPGAMVLHGGHHSAQNSTTTGTGEVMIGFIERGLGQGEELQWTWRPPRERTQRHRTVRTVVRSQGGAVRRSARGQPRWCRLGGRRARVGRTVSGYHVDAGRPPVSSG